MTANRTTLAVLGIVLAIVLFFAVNLISSLTLRGYRADLTEDDRFTVSENTVEVLKSIEEPITLTLYQSSGLIEEAPALRTYAARVDEMLRTYAGLAGGKLRIRRVDPSPFSTEEDRAVSYGLRGVPLNRSGERGYFGLVGTNTVDQLETIELFSPSRERFLEYDLTRIVDRLTEREEPTIGVIDGLGMFGDAQQGRYPSFLIEMLNDDFELEQVAMDVKVIPDNVDALMIVHPYRLNDQARYAIDQFVLSGKPALAFIDTLAENSQRAFNNPNVPQFPASDLKPVSDAWGIEIVPEKVVGDANMALQVTGLAPGGRRVNANYLPWLMIRPEMGGVNVLNDSDAITAELELMRMSSAGALRPRDGAGTTVTTLIQTTRQSMLFDEKFVESRPNPSELIAQFQPSGEVHILAARVSGPARTAFPDGPPPPDPDAEPEQQPPGRQPEPKPHLAESAGDINVIVVADVDMLTNTHVANEGGAPNSNNADFVTNALQNLTGGSELIGLRGRGLSFRPFELVDNIEDAAEAQYKSTEQQLTARLQQIQERVAQLQQPGAAGEVTEVAAVSEETQRAIAEANREMLETREQLRDVQANMRAEIDALDTRLRLINILLVPGIVVLIGIAVAVFRRVRLATYLRRRHATA